MKAGQAERSGACRAVRGAAAEQSLTVGNGDKADSVGRSPGTIGRVCGAGRLRRRFTDVEVESAVERKWSERLRRALDWSDQLQHAPV